MSNGTMKQVGQTSSSSKNNNKSDSSVEAKFLPNPTSKTPISALSPHVPEFVPKSFALKKESPSIQYLEERSSQEKPLSNVQAVEGLSRKPGVSGEPSSRGWWDEATLKIEIDVTTSRNAPKPLHSTQGLLGRSSRHPRENRTEVAWRPKRFSEEMDSNWRLRQSDSDQKSPKNNELTFARDKKDIHFRDVQQKKEHSLSRSVEDDGQQRIGRIRASRGRGRGRTAWMNHTPNQNNSIQSVEPKDLKVSDQDNVKRIGRGRGCRSNNLDHAGIAVPKKTSNSGEISTSNKHSNLDLMGNEKEIDGSSKAEDDGWIVVGNKKKMEEQKGSGKETDEKMSTGNQFSAKLKKLNKRDDKVIVINSQQKMEKWRRRRDEKKETRVDNNEQKRKTFEDKEITSENIIAPNDFDRQRKHYEGKSKAVLSSVGIESEGITNKTTQEKEPKKVEIVKIIKTEQNQKEMKILLKKNNERKLPHEEIAVRKDPGFELCEGDDEFPDLQASSKASSTSLASDWLSGGSRMPIISYSAVLKAMPKPRTQPSRNLPNEKYSSTTPDKQDHDENEGPSKKKKKKKKKKTKDYDGNTKQVPQEAKKTKQPMQFDLGDWLSTIEKIPPKITKDKETHPKKAVTIATGVLQIKVKDQPSATSRAPAVKVTHGLPTTDKTFHNILDSTAPVVKRGKERETPKKKKTSQMKRIILKEREEKRKASEGEGNQDENSESQSLAEEHHSSEETGDGHKSEGKSSSEDNDLTVLQSKDDVITHHHGNADDTAADLSSNIDQTVAPSEDDVKAQIHSRRFREYCDNVMDKELNNTTLQLLQKLVMFQDRQYHRDPVKSKAKRRFVVGLREVTKHLKLKKIKLVIISPNVERIKSAGGLDDTLYNIISIAHQNGVPVVFALRRQVLGRVLHKKVPVSAIGVFYYDGAEDEHKKLMDLTEKARDVYAQRWKAAYEELVERIRKERAVEMSRGVQEEGSSSRDPCGEKAEIPNESENELKQENEKKVSKDSYCGDILKMEDDEESECNRNQEYECEREEEIKDELLEEDSLEEKAKDKEYECKRNEENGWQREGEIKDGILKQNGNSSEESEGEDDLETENIGNDKMGLKEEMKDGILKQNENSSEESKDEDDLETENIGSYKMELDETNEKENEWDVKNQSVSVEMDLRVEEL